MKKRIVGIALAALLAAPFVTGAQVMTLPLHNDQYGSDWNSSFTGYYYPQNYQLYWCDGYYSYSPCPVYYYPTTYYYPTYYYQPYYFDPYWGGYGWNFNFNLGF